MAALGGFIRSQRALAGLSLRDLAERTAVSNAYLSQVERGLHEPSLRVLHSIATALSVPLESLLAHARLVPGGDGEASRALAPATGRDTESAIREDTRLTEAQKFALLSVYRSFLAAGR
jgi:transcriptional regulator with XRE-family HTH domain